MSDNETNDERAPYGHCSGCGSSSEGATHQMGTVEHPNREPMLSDYDDILDYEDTYGDGWHTYYEKSAMDKLQKHYENLITSWELRAVNTVRGDVMDHIFECAKMHVMGDTLKSVKFCPGCGAKIVSE